MHYPPPSPSSYSISSHRPTSPPPPSQSPRLTRRPTHQKHKSTSSLSSLAQLNLGGSFGGSNGRETPPPSLGPASSISHSPSILHSPRWEEGTWGMQRSNSISAAAGGQWGAFGVGSSAAIGVGREYEDVQNRTFCKWCVRISSARLERRSWSRCRRCFVRRGVRSGVIFRRRAGSTPASNPTATLPLSISVSTSVTELG